MLSLLPWARETRYRRHAEPSPTVASSAVLLVSQPLIPSCPELDAAFTAAWVEYGFDGGGLQAGENAGEECVVHAADQVRGYLVERVEGTVAEPDTGWTRPDGLEVVVLQHRDRERQSAFSVAPARPVVLAVVVAQAPAMLACDPDRGVLCGLVVAFSYHRGNK
jgi:hypothetical protein